MFGLNCPTEGLACEAAGPQGKGVSTGSRPSSADQWTCNPRLPPPGTNLIPTIGCKFIVNSNCLQPAFATWDLHSSEADSSILRVFSPEARLVVKTPGGEVNHSSFPHQMYSFYTSFSRHIEHFPANHKFQKEVNVTVGGVEGGDARGYLNRTGLRERVQPVKGHSLTFVSYSVKNIRWS